MQPQLYRISADNQNIRVRFAVLKVEEKYISQLVDNDPGLAVINRSARLIQQMELVLFYTTYYSW